MARKTASKIDAEAADWVARMDRGPLAPDEERGFEAWLDSDLRVIGAYGRMRAIALASERARALGGHCDPVAQTHSWSRRKVIGAGGAIAATGLFAYGAWRFLRASSGYKTAKGEIRIIPLEDGSVITLNTES